MIWTLLKIRFRSIFAGLTAQKAKRKKPMSLGMILLYVFLFLYLIAAVGSTMAMLFGALAPVYHAIELDWLYFAMAGVWGLGLSVIGSAFTTQSQLYDAKDNDLLLSMPVPPRMILLSRMIPLLTTNLLFGGIVMVPAIIMYGVFVKFTLVGLLLQILAYLCICVLSQAIASVLGWLLHLLLRKLSPTAASLVYTVSFLSIYFLLYGNTQTLLAAMTANSQQLAGSLESWVWPLYAMGTACTGNGLNALIFLGICGAAFALAYWLLSITFLKTATASRRSRKAKKLKVYSQESGSPKSAVCRKELRKFLGSPVYLTNMGIGLLMTLAFPIVSIFTKDSFMPVIQMLGREFAPILVCAVLAFTISTSNISTPSVSLEGKSLWIMKVLPVSALDVLHGKLRLHLLLTVPVSVVSGLATSILLGCTLPEVLLCALIPGLLATANGLTGMWTGLKWAKFDYINDAYPCKQSAAVVVSMFGTMGLAALFGLIYWALWGMVSPILLLALTALLLAAGCFGLYRLMVTWGVRKWESLQA